MVLQTPNYKEIAKLFIVHYSLLSWPLVKKKFNIVNKYEKKVVCSISIKQKN